MRPSSLPEWIFARRALSKDEQEAVGALKGAVLETAQLAAKLTPGGHDQTEGFRRLKEALSWFLSALVNNAQPELDDTPVDGERVK
jgi:hypothetical protein